MLKRSTPRPILTGSINQCPLCLITLTTTRGFDAHGTGDIEKGTRRCLSVPEMKEEGMRVTKEGHWRLPSDLEARAKKAERVLTGPRQ